MGFANMNDTLSAAPPQVGSASLRSRQRNKIHQRVAEVAMKANMNAGQYGSRGDGRWDETCGPLSRLDHDLRARIVECSLTDADKACMDRCTAELQALVVKLGSPWRLKLFGSAANGFCTRNSDVDATCVEERPAEGEASAHASAADVLRERFAPLVRGHPKFSIVEEVLGASIPILKLRFEGAIDVDLSCRNGDALQNTRLLRGYADIGGRVRDLGVLVKLWAKAANVWGASRRFLSSYAFTLLAIYFMQVHPDVQLPCLPTASFLDEAGDDAQEKVAAARSMWACELSLAELVSRFFAFYHLEFQWGHEVVSPRLGRRLWATDPVFEHLRGRWSTRLHVEDPFKLERNLHCVLGPEVEERELRIAFAEAHNALQMGGLPLGLGSRLSSPVGSPGLLPEGDPDLLPLLVQEADLGEGAGGFVTHTAERSAEETGEFSDGLPSSGGGGARKSSRWSSGASAVASTASGASAAPGEGSGTESPVSEGEPKASDGSDLDQLRWWKYLGQLGLLAAEPGQGFESVVDDCSPEHRQPPRWQHAQARDEEVLSGDGVAGGRIIGVSEMLTGTAFASRSSSRIAARLSSQLATGGEVPCCGGFAYQ